MSFGDFILVFIGLTAIYGLYKLLFRKSKFRIFLIVFLACVLGLGGGGVFIWWQFKQMKEKPYYKSEWEDGQSYDLNGNPINTEDQ